MWKVLVGGTIGFLLACLALLCTYLALIPTTSSPDTTLLVILITFWVGSQGAILGGLAVAASLILKALRLRRDDQDNLKL